MYKFQKHAVDNCRVFKTYSLQHIFAISPELAQRVRQPEDRAPAATPGAHAAAEEAAIDAELAQLRERAHSVGPACVTVGSYSPVSLIAPSLPVIFSQANATLGVLQQEESALSQQLEQSAKRLEWLSSLSSNGEPLFPLSRRCFPWPRFGLADDRRVAPPAGPSVEEDIGVIAQQVGEVRAAVASIGEGLGEMTRQRPAVGAALEGLPAVAAQFEADKATTTTASRDDLLKLSAPVSAS